LTQERTDIPGNATGVLRFVDSQKNSHSGLLGGAGRRSRCLYPIPHESADSRGRPGQGHLPHYEFVSVCAKDYAETVRPVPAFIREVPP
jgi:hypothetical protein